MDPDKRNAWLRRLDKKYPHQVVLPRRQLYDDRKIMDFLSAYIGRFDMYVEDDYAVFVRYCFQDPLEAEAFRARFEIKGERFQLAS
jgi:hypothetical protein